MRDWFGFVPVYFITIDASFCENSNDREFCALIEHELYHIARMREYPGLINGIDIATTPEGFKFTHQQFVKEANLFGRR